MKKTISFIASAIVFFGISVVSAEKIAVKSDIKAYIDYTPIRSYNIDGYTYIIAEELRNYGFDVIWNGDERNLKISRNELEVPLYTRELFYADSDKVSTSYRIYPTDIITYLHGREIHGFNIGGRTIIQLDELSEYGHFLWDAEKRQVSVMIFEAELEKIYDKAENKVHTESTGSNVIDTTKYTGQVNDRGEPHGIGRVKITDIESSGSVSFVKVATILGYFKDGKPCGRVFIDMFRTAGKTGELIYGKFIGEVDGTTDVGANNFGSMRVPYYVLENLQNEEIFPDTNLYKSGLWFEENCYRNQTGITLRSWYDEEGYQSFLKTDLSGTEFTD